ncbi:hypothetical protein BC332_25640 [Capsicum chinense]|nr:hypothetical protein BC332_25640 [Capsicum chinense]
MKIKNDDFDLFIVGQYTNSFSSQGLVNYGEWIISDDESLTEFLRAPSDYASQIKLNILQVYIKKEWKNCSAHSPTQTNLQTRFDDPTNVVDARLTQYNTFFEMNAPQYIVSSNMPTQSLVPDLNETVNENDCDQPNYGELSQGDDSEPNNVEGGECSYDSSSSDNDVRYPIKDCQKSILNKYRKTISRRKAYLGRKRTFELVYENWESSFRELPRFMAAMKHVNPGFIDE